MPVCSPISLVEDLTHQAMHCVYADVEMSDLWTYSIDPGMTISDFYSGPSSDRTLSVLVHSILTEIASLEALSDQYQTGSLNSVEQLEAIARIGFIIRKFQIDVCYANYIPMLDGEAREVFCRITSFGAKLADSMNDHTKDFSYLSQEYNFSMPAFIRDNPFQRSDRRSGSGNYPTTRPIASPTAPTI